MSVTYLNPDNHHRPAGKYSHVAIAEPGSLAFVAGQVAYDTDGRLVGAGDAGAQFRQTFRNLRTILDTLAVGSNDIVELRTFLVGADSLPAFREAREEIFAEAYGDGPYPPNTLLVISGLAAPELLVEVSATVAVAG